MDGYILTSNRDEAPARHAVSVHSQKIGQAQIIFPRDPHAGGSWFAMSDKSAVACLLNGAFEPFAPNPRFTHSRGLVLLDSFWYDEVDSFTDEYNFKPAAPFTLILQRDFYLHQIIWDGADCHYTLLDPAVPHFWSSVTLYPAATRAWRRTLFDKWLEMHPAPTQNDIISFHRYGGRGDIKNDFVMNRNEAVRTLSISSVARLLDKLVFHYLDLDDQENNFVQTLDIPGSLATKN